MFRGDRLSKPKLKSFIGALIIALFSGVGAQLSSLLGYFVALLAMLMIIIALQMESIWPKERKQENSVVFSFFWGCMIGALLPYLFTVYLDGGFIALYELFRREPWH